MTMTDTAKGGAPSGPPPAYDDATAKPAQVTAHGDVQAGPSTTAPAPIPQSSAPPHAGPTPITAQGAHLLPFHDPRSPYAMQQAISRARWRFLEAFLIAWAISLLVGGTSGYAATQGFKN